ncbi:unnamed protein product [Cochlearia groenlandica]
MSRSNIIFSILRKSYDPFCLSCLKSNSFSSSSSSSSLGLRATNKELNQMIRTGYIIEARSLFEKLESKNTVTWNTMISGYVKRRQMKQAQNLFDEMSQRDVVSWNAMISGYVSCGGTRFLEEARKLFDEMPERDSFTWNTMISGYAKNRKISEAMSLFEAMPLRNFVSWSAMITGFCQNGDSDRAVEMFRTMPVKDSSSLCALVSGLVKSKKLEEALCVLNEYESSSVGSGQEHLVYAYNTLIVGYGETGQVETARRLFDQIPNLCNDECRGSFRRNVVSWNSMIKAYLKVGDLVSARLLFDEMKDQDRDTITWNTMIDGYVHASMMKDAYDLFSEMPIRDTHSWNMMVSGFASVGNIELARDYFERTPEKNTVSWNSIIAAYEKNNDYEEAVDLFISMNIEGEKKPDPHTLTSILSVSAVLVDLRLGTQIHQIVVKTVIPDVPIHNALITMYSRCGDITNSRRVFDEMRLKREVITWNAMIGGYSFHGDSSQALNLFRLMKKNGVRPSHITFVSVLNACARVGLVDEAKSQFMSMVNEYKIKPQMEHYSSLVDVISRQGHFDEAMDVIKSMHFDPDKTVWGALLDACRVHNNAKLAHVAAEAFWRLEPESSTPYVLLYNMYVDMGLWDEASKVRMLMESKRIKKERGSSWVDSST